jgi:hypothetical protein
MNKTSVGSIARRQQKGYRMATIKPIETQYKGYRFRSRLEARWAVFFDALGVRWEYEKEGYDLGEAGWYLPDFWLPHTVEELAQEGWGLWCEIKPLPATDTELQKAIALAVHTKHNVLIFQGSCGQGEYEVTKISTVHFDQPEIFRGMYFRNDGGHVSLENDSGMGSYPAVYNGNLEAAFKAVKSARFEHGETPK